MTLMFFVLCSFCILLDERVLEMYWIHHKLVGCCFIVEYVEEEFYFLKILVFAFAHLVRHMFYFLLSNWYYLKACLKEMCIVDCCFWKWGAALAGSNARHYCQVVVFNENQQSQHFIILMALLEVRFLLRTVTWLIVIFVCFSLSRCFQVKVKEH